MMSTFLAGMFDRPPLALIAALFLFVYPFALYPVAVAVMARLIPWKSRSRESREDLPTVAFVICALNEENVIARKIENCLALEYPRDRLSIVVVSDGSVDRTGEIARGYLPRIELIEQPRRRGKVANLNEVIASRGEEIIVQSDANVFYDPQALMRLVRRLDDPGIGCVTGKVVLRETTEQIQASEEQYYALEWRIQEMESAVHSMVGVDGAMYAFRRELYRPCPNDTLIEDFVMATAFVRQGKRVVMEPRALAWETGVASIREEYRRKVRIAAGAAQALLRGNAWPVGAPLRYWFLFLSHKFLRWISPVTGVVAIALALYFRTHPLAQLVLAGTGLLAILAAIRLLSGWKLFLFEAPFYFVFGQVATLVGLIKGIAGTQSVLWAKASR